MCPKPKRLYPFSNVVQFFLGHPMLGDDDHLTVPLVGKKKAPDRSREPVCQFRAKLRIKYARDGLKLSAL